MVRIFFLLLFLKIPSCVYVTSFLNPIFIALLECFDSLIKQRTKYIQAYCDMILFSGSHLLCPHRRLSMLLINMNSIFTSTLNAVFVMFNISDLRIHNYIFFSSLDHYYKLTYLFLRYMCSIS